MSKVQHVKCNSNTGFVGLTRRHVNGRDMISVSWHPARGVQKQTTIYFGGPSKLTCAQAMAKGIALRKAAIAARIAREKRP